MAFLLLICALASAYHSEKSESATILAVPEPESRFLATRWPPTVAIGRQTGEKEFTPPKRYPLVVLPRNGGPEGHDTFSDHTLIGDGSHGYIWAFLNSEELPKALGDVLQASKDHWSPDTMNKRSMNAALRDFWDDYLRDRIIANFKLLGHTVRTVDDKPQIFLTHDGREQAVKDVWGADQHELGEMMHGVVPRNSEMNGVPNLHKDDDISSPTLVRVAGDARAAGYMDFNIWVAFVDISYSPLVIADYIKGTQSLIISEMKAGDYVMFRTSDVLHGGSYANDEISDDDFGGWAKWLRSVYETTCDWLKGSCDADEPLAATANKPARRSADFRFWVKFEK